MDMKVNPFQQKALQGLQQPAKQQHKVGGQEGNLNTGNAGGLSKPQQAPKTDSSQSRQDFGQNVKELERLQKADGQKGGTRNAGQQDPNELSRAASLGNIPGQKLNLMA